MGKRYGGSGHRNPNRQAYDGFVRPEHTRPLPPDFREQYLEDGWDCQWTYGCNWRVMCRWIDEAGGEELIAARAEVVCQRRKRRYVHRVNHAGGWTAERLAARG